MLTAAPPRLRIVSVARHTTVHGGGELVAAWILEALKQQHDLTVFGYERPDWNQVNHYFGTSLDARQVEYLSPPRWVSPAFRAIGSHHIEAVRFQRFAAFMRLARPIPPRFDLAISPLDEIDFGMPGLQYVHFPWVPTGYGRGARRPWEMMAGFDLDRVRQNPTAANSRYTAAAVRERIGVDPVVINPPCPGEFDPLPWSERRDEVVMVTRLTRHKRIDMAVDAVRRVREGGAEVGLTVIGNWLGISRADRAAVEPHLRSHGWIRVVESPSRPDLIRILCSARYGLHPMPEEPYGIAVAEMVRAGCIPLTRRSGGPPEITGPDERLRFDSGEEAAAKLEALMRSPAERQRILESLAPRREHLRPERFVREVRDWVLREAEALGRLPAGTGSSGARPKRSPGP